MPEPSGPVALYFFCRAFQGLYKKLIQDEVRIKLKTTYYYYLDLPLSMLRSTQLAVQILHNMCRLMIKQKLLVKSNDLFKNDDYYI